MKVICLHNKTEIESFLRRNPFLHIYSIGDLDDFFWPYTTWYAIRENESIGAIVLLYTGFSTPSVLALAEEELDSTKELLSSIIHLLPKRFYLHLSPGLEKILKEHYRLESHGTHYKMALKNKSLLDSIDTSRVIRLSREDLKDILKLYRESYPGNWFEPRMLDTNQYYGIRREDGLISIAGVHVYSQRYKVAALGNITTHPDFRGKGLVKSVTAKLCKSLMKTVSDVGLNVKTDNLSAIVCYKKLGFEIISSYEEYLASSQFELA
ncbi:MAG: GNAT family N-acetyltransferase [Candidatus Edwardsbacteria bacterium]